MRNISIPGTLKPEKPLRYINGPLAKANAQNFGHLPRSPTITLSPMVGKAWQPIHSILALHFGSKAMSVCPACGSISVTNFRTYNRHLLLRCSDCDFVFTAQRDYATAQYEDVYSEVS